MGREIELLQELGSVLDPDGAGDAKQRVRARVSSAVREVRLSRPTQSRVRIGSVIAAALIALMVSGAAIALGAGGESVPAKITYRGTTPAGAVQNFQVKIADARARIAVLEAQIASSETGGRSMEEAVVEVAALRDQVLHLEDWLTRVCAQDAPVGCPPVIPTG